MAFIHTFHGTVFTGIGKGSYYVGHPEYKMRILEKLGYEPYPGTLNLRLREPREIADRKKLRMIRGVKIAAFEYNGERFSSLNCFDGEMDGLRVSLLIVEITHYDDSVIELISPIFLRGKLGLNDGDSVSATIWGAREGQGTLRP